MKTGQLHSKLCVVSDAAVCFVRVSGLGPDALGRAGVSCPYHRLLKPQRLVGPCCKASYLSYRKPSKKMALVVEQVKFAWRNHGAANGCSSDLHSKPQLLLVIHAPRLLFKHHLQGYLRYLILPGKLTWATGLPGMAKKGEPIQTKRDSRLRETPD